MPDRATSDPVVAALGEVVRARRKALGLPQDRVGGVSRVWLQRIESGTANPSVVSLLRLAEALDTTAADLLGEAEHRARTA